MSWVKIDDQFFDHPKTVKAGRDGRDLFIAGLCHCAGQLTDGFVAAEMLPLLALKAGIGNGKKAAAALVNAGLWEETDGGYQVHDYLDYNPSAEKVKAERAAAKERMNRARGARKAPDSADVRPNKPRISDEVRLTPSRPPSREDYTPTQAGEPVRADRAEWACSPAGGEGKITERPAPAAAPAPAPAPDELAFPALRRLFENTFPADDHPDLYRTLAQKRREAKKNAPAVMRLYMLDQLSAAGISDPGPPGVPPPGAPAARRLPPPPEGWLRSYDAGRPKSAAVAAEEVTA